VAAIAFESFDIAHGVDVLARRHVGGVRATRPGCRARVEFHRLAPLVALDGGDVPAALEPPGESPTFGLFTSFAPPPSGAAINDWAFRLDRRGGAGRMKVCPHRDSQCDGRMRRLYRQNEEHSGCLCEL
jgi:hypothetical protein